jgi:hypothetical protein
MATGNRTTPKGDAYKPSTVRSGYSKADDKNAKEYRDTGRKTAVEKMGRYGSVIKSQKDADASVGNAKNLWYQNERTKEGRGYNKANMQDAKDQLSKAQLERKLKGKKL